MSESINIYEAKAKLSELLKRAEQGEEIIISRAGVPIAKLVPITQVRERKLKFGEWKGKMWIADDFDGPLPPEIQAAFDGESEDDLF